MNDKNERGTAEEYAPTGHGTSQAYTEGDVRGEAPVYEMSGAPGAYDNSRYERAAALERTSTRRTRTSTVRRDSGNGSMAKPAMAAVAAAPIVWKLVSKWRSNPKHMKVRDYMTSDAVVIMGTETVAEAARTLDAFDIGSAPICSEGRLVGMLTDRDIVTKVVAQGLTPETTFARELAEGTPVVVDEGDSIDKAARTMQEYDVRRLPVVDHDRVVGMIAQADIVEALGAERAGVLVEDISTSPSNN